MMYSRTDDFPETYQWFLTSLRRADPDVHIIAGVSPAAASHGSRAFRLAREHRVTLKAVNLSACEGAETPGAVKWTGGSQIRHVCVAEYPTLKLEWARFALFRDWLRDCADCTGWALLTDGRDTFFQEAPFAKLPALAPNREGKDLFLIEEWNQTNKFWFSSSSLNNCYGSDALQPRESKVMLCSGTVVGTREGLGHFFEVYLRELNENVAKGEQCQPPKCVDQAVLNYVYYEGKLGNRAGTFKYGEGNVITLGKPCSRTVRVAGKLVNKHSLTDVAKVDGEGFVLLDDGSRAPVVHQWDRCWNWLMPVLAKRFKAGGGR